MDVEQCKRGKALAQERVREFFNQCVPAHRKQMFTEFAKRNHPTLWAEIEQLKAVLNNEPQCIQTWTYTCNRYVVVSKELIRKVSFALCRAVLP